MLVESDSGDIRTSSRLVWAATRWIAGCKGWSVAGDDEEWNLEYAIDEEVGADGRVRSTQGRGRGEEIEVVRTLERNWVRFMGLLDDTR